LALPHGLPPVERRFPTNLLAQSGAEGPNHSTPDAVRVQPACGCRTNARLGGRSWGFQHPRYDSGTKRPSDFLAAVRAAEDPQQWQLATSLRAGTIAAIFPRPAEQHKRIGKQGGWWGSVTHGVARSSYRCRTHIRGGLSRQLVFPLRIVVRSWIFVALVGNGALGPEVANSREGLHAVDLVF
jgi:hypothetical protein